MNSESSVFPFINAVHSLHVLQHKLTGDGFFSPFSLLFILTLPSALHHSVISIAWHLIFAVFASWQTLDAISCGVNTSMK